MSNEEVKEESSESLYKQKKWDSSILVNGGIGYYTTEAKYGDNVEPSKRYRVSMTKNREGKMLKWKIKTATGEVFSVAAKTQNEAQAVVNELFGKRQYSVSQMLV